VKVSFFGGLTIGRVAEPEPSSDGVAVLASPLDLLATKLKVLLQRAERKDYEDVAVLLASGLTLTEGLGAARALYGSAFPVSEALKALVYFADGDLDELPASTQQQLIEAVKAVDAVPVLERSSLDLSPSEPLR
jgi:predicted TIM-barrel fold metal-dependent hydrolase